jgi:hypothetical protein
MFNLVWTMKIIEFSLRKNRTFEPLGGNNKFDISNYAFSTLAPKASMVV